MNSNWNLPFRHVPSHLKGDQSLVWNRIRLSYEQKLFGQITSISYNHAGTLLGCTASNQFTLLRVLQSNEVVVNEQSDRSIYSIRFRDDDKLYLQCIEKRLHLKSSETAFERQFLGHTRDVRCASFIGSHNFASGSDDTTVRLWDLLRDTELMTARGHTDYVRSLEPYNSGAFFSGSYDHTIQLWDPRASFGSSLQKSGNAVTQAVESLCFISEKSILGCASGDQVILFDVRMGLKTPLHQSSCHTKTVTAIAYSSLYGTILTGSLDNRVKMFDVEGCSLHCLTNKRFENPVSSVAVHPLSQEFCVGMTNGDMRVFKVSSHELRGSTVELATESEVALREDRSQEVIASKMRLVQQQLRTFRYQKALKSALYSRKADVIISTVDELIRRGALHIALSNQNDRSIAQILRFAVSHIDILQFSNTLFCVLEDIFEIYGSALRNSVFLHREMLIARKKLGHALETINQMEKLQGVMELIMNSGE